MKTQSVTPGSQFYESSKFQIRRDKSETPTSSQRGGVVNRTHRIAESMLQASKDSNTYFKSPKIATKDLPETKLYQHSTPTYMRHLERNIN